MKKKEVLNGVLATNRGATTEAPELQTSAWDVNWDLNLGPVLRPFTPKPILKLRSQVEPIGSKIFGPGPDLLSIFGPGTQTRTRLIKIVRPGPGPATSLHA
jgi:hypothetical protein